METMNRESEMLMAGDLNEEIQMIEEMTEAGTAGVTVTVTPLLTLVCC